MTLDDHDPLWEQHNGGSGHRDDPEWSAPDLARAGAFYAATGGRARSILDLMIDRPGQLLDANWIADQIAGRSMSGLARPQVVARGIRDMRTAQTASGRRYPFYWWRGQNGSPTMYAMKPAVAALFRQARLATGSEPWTPEPLPSAHRGLARTDGGATPLYWWERELGENVFMEITRRDDVGADLKAPSAARGGGVTASYALVALVRPGDVVIHYDSREEAIIGVSVAASPPEPAPIYWVARGSYARRAGERARWLPGIRVLLGHYRKLATPLTLAEIRAQKNALLALREQIQARANRQPIYFPWIPYQETLRTFQSYLVKMPREAIALFPELSAKVAAAEALSPTITATSPVDDAAEAIEQAAGRSASRRRGQGFQLDQAAKVAVEAHAMNAATEFYDESWEVTDVHGRKSYDLVCRRDDEVKHVEVKGTTTDGTDVILTPNEVRHAREYTQTALFILSNVALKRAEDGTVAATGGVHHLYDPWNIDQGQLTPIGFRYQPDFGRPAYDDQPPTSAIHDALSTGPD